MYTIMSCENNDHIISSFPICMPFIYSSCLIAVAWTSNTILKRSGDGGQPGLVPDLSGELFSLCELSMMLAVGFSIIAFIMLKYAAPTLTLLSIFIINRCCTLSNAFSASLDMSM